MSGKVSVIIPAYNVEDYIGICIESVLNQTYKNYEIIIINDGSTDNTLDIIKGYEKEKENIKVIDITNHGQGYARNMALQESTGEYVIFLDSDDFIENVTLQVAVEKIEKDNSDLVVFDWKYFFENSQKFKYVNSDRFFGKKLLEGEEILDLFRIKHYFTVNKLYSKKFLTENNIKYGEGFIYEDNPFWVEVVVNARRVSLIHSPLYNVRVTQVSTTKTNTSTDMHYKGYITALKSIMETIQKKPENNYYYLYNYIMKKFNLYYKKRVPKKYKRKFLNDYIEVMNEAIPLELNQDVKIKNTLIRLGFKYKIFQKKKKLMFYLMYKMFLLRKWCRAKKNKLKKKIKKKKKSIENKYKPNPKINYNRLEYKESIGKEKEDIILFMGFDYRYTGNSRYLFEELLRQGYENVFFVTENEMVEEKYRIAPKTRELFNKLYNSKVVIFESWIPKWVRRSENTTIIQLWHGTPLKKMLFDSEETEIITKNRQHKINKYNDIQRWNYLVLDNRNIAPYFETSFLMPKEKMLFAGYPRVKFLIDNKNNEELKKEIKKKANIEEDKKIVLYLPTWRDYNYGKKEDKMEFNYFLDAEQLQKHLGNEYVIISKNHTYLNNDTADAITNVDIETQELLLIADYLITDYSSVMFDAFPIDLPVIVLAKDYEEYQKSRGVYQSLWEKIEPFVTITEEQTATKIQNYNLENEEYKRIKEELCYKSETDLAKFIVNIK